MIPQEKAQELVSSFISIRNIKLSDYSVIYLPAAKQCALIAVDEILKYVPQFEYGQLEVTTTTEYNYLQEVKQEIAKL